MCMHKHACSHVHIQVATVPRPWNKVCRRPIFVRNHAKFNNFGCDNQQTKTMMESKKKTQNKKQSGKVSIIESYNCDSTSTSCCCHRRHYCPYLCYCCCRCTDGHEWYAVKTPIIWTKQKIHAKVACDTTFSVCRIWYSIRSIYYESYNISYSCKFFYRKICICLTMSHSGMVYQLMEINWKTNRSQTFRFIYKTLLENRYLCSIENFRIILCQDQIDTF